jgi:hypothetical protein
MAVYDKQLTTLASNEDTWKYKNKIYD